MKTKNFPEKKNQRRKRALQRLFASHGDDSRTLAEIKVLKERTADSLRHVRTKKSR